MAEFFTPIRNLLKVISSLNADEIAFEIAKQPTLEKLVIELNTKDQLFEKGEDSFGKKLVGKNIVKDGKYSPLTVSIKRAKGQPTNRVTLFDTGDFYASFNITPYKGGFVIDADEQKDETNLFDEFGLGILGLNQTNLQIIIEYFKNELLEKVNKRLQAA